MSASKNDILKRESGLHSASLEGVQDIAASCSMFFRDWKECPAQRVVPSVQLVCSCRDEKILDSQMDIQQSC